MRKTNKTTLAVLALATLLAMPCVADEYVITIDSFGANDGLPTAIGSISSAGSSDLHFALNANVAISVLEFLPDANGRLSFRASMAPAADVSNAQAYVFVVNGFDASGTTNMPLLNINTNINAVVVAPQPPGAIVDLNAGPGDGLVTLTWSNADGATSYDVYMDDMLLAAGQTSPYVATGLNNGTEYDFYVIANGLGGSTQSNTDSATPADVTAPDAPSAPTLTPGNTEIEVTLPSLTGDEVGFRVYTSLDDMSYAEDTSTPQTSSWTIDGLTNGVLLYVKISAEDEASNESALSAASSETPEADEPAVLDWSSTAQQQKIVADDRATGDRFGISLGISGDTIVSGMPNDDDTAVGSGSVAVFTRSGSTWTQQQKFVASDPAASDNLGISVAIDGDTIVAGASGDDDGGTNSGSAYVFTRSGSTWTQQAKLVASDPASSALFGNAVAISGDTIVVGAEQDDDGGANSGSAYVFTRSGSTWTEQQKLVASDPAGSDLFGCAVAIDGDTIVIGARNDDDGGANSGSAYVFTRSGSTWTQQQKLVMGSPSGTDYFGISVAIDGDTIVVGSTGDDDPTANNGSATVFTRSGSTWTEQQRLVASDAAGQDAFAASVAIDGDTIVVGSTGDDDTASNSGSAYIFTRSGSTWTQQAKLVASDPGSGDEFGKSVAAYEDTVVVGSCNDYADGGYQTGSAYVFVAPAE